MGLNRGNDGGASVAIYWDFENLHASLVDAKFGDGTYAKQDNRFKAQEPLVDVQALVELSASFGPVAINRAYGNWQFIGRYRDALLQSAVELIQLFPPGAAAKNGADIKLCLDATEDQQVRPRWHRRHHRRLQRLHAGGPKDQGGGSHLDRHQDSPQHQQALFLGYGIDSFDTTSHLYGAFMDAKANYDGPTAGLGLDDYTAIRLPRAVEDRAPVRASLRGQLRKEDVVAAEQAALNSLRLFDAGQLGLEPTVAAVMTYQRMYQAAKSSTEKTLTTAIDGTEHRLRLTLESAPWKAGASRVCRESVIEVMVFRSSNRNKRRGFHNLYVYSEHVARLSGTV